MHNKFRAVFSVITLVNAFSPNAYVQLLARILGIGIAFYAVIRVSMGVAMDRARVKDGKYPYFYPECYLYNLEDQKFVYYESEYKCRDTFVENPDKYMPGYDYVIENYRQDENPVFAWTVAGEDELKYRRKWLPHKYVDRGALAAAAKCLTNPAAMYRVPQAVVATAQRVQERNIETEMKKATEWLSEEMERADNLKQAAKFIKITDTKSCARNVDELLFSVTSYKDRVRLELAVQLFGRDRLYMIGGDERKEVRVHLL